MLVIREGHSQYTLRFDVAFLGDEVRRHEATPSGLAEDCGLRGDGGSLGRLLPPSTDAVKPFGVHPSGTLIKRSGSARGFFLQPSEKLIRIGGIRVD